jgi:predicted hotdog family 3-hydroxylacyl-ACP dehydratase
MSLPAFPLPSELLPHTGPMCLLDTVQQHNDAGTTCLATPRQDGRFDREHGVTCLLAVELMAQAAAAHAALASPADTPRGGYLVALQRAEFHVDVLPLQPLTVHVQQTYGGDGPLAAFTGTVHLHQQELARAELRVSRH